MNRLSRCLQTPQGLLEIQADEAGICAIKFVEHPQGPQSDAPLLEMATNQLVEYFAGVRRHFDLPLAPRGTAFQQKVWQALQQVGYGQTTSYKEIARRIGHPAAVRAVGAANGRNPIAIVVPCHRIIGANGTLTGYAGGLGRKAALLKLEQAQKVLL